VRADGGLPGALSLARGSHPPTHRVVVFPRTCYFVMFDDPAGFTRIVGKFLAAIDGE
jgi:hypothetical protein